MAEQTYGRARLVLALLPLLGAEPALGQTKIPDPGNTESLTVTGHRQHFESAPVPGPPLPPPPDKPPVHLGRYKISGDQEQHDGIDAQTGAQIGAFGTAYTGASPVAGGLAAQHPN